MGRVTDLIIIGDEAWTPEEYAAYRRTRDRDNARRRARRAEDPEYRARYNARMQAWRQANRARWREIARDSMRRLRAA